jgi:hypothetical protein
MRLAIVLALLVACEGGRSPDCEWQGQTFEIGETFPAGDGCNTCSCTAEGVGCTLIACVDGGVVDGNPASCAATNGCVVGPSCGATCCGQGEKCVGGTCMCGNGPACDANDTCEAAGPIGGDACGSICCGFSGPCPL